MKQNPASRSRSGNSHTNRVKPRNKKSKRSIPETGRKRATILILYHSGSGNTRTLSELLQKFLNLRYNVRIHSISPSLEIGSLLSGADHIVIAYPTHHGRPSASMMEFVDRIASSRGLPSVTLLTTYGQHDGGSLRLLSDRLRGRGFSVTGLHGIRSPSSDRLLLSPIPLPYMYEFDRQVRNRMGHIVRSIRFALKGGIEVREGERIGRRWSDSLAGVVQGYRRRRYRHFQNRLTVERESCGRCFQCVDRCIRGAWTIQEGYPSFDVSLCEFCLGCVHRCPGEAIHFSRRMRNRPRLDTMRHIDLKDSILHGK